MRQRDGYIFKGIEIFQHSCFEVKASEVKAPEDYLTQYTDFHDYFHR